MRAIACLLLVFLNAESIAAEKIPLNIFLGDIRDQLYALEQPDNRDPTPVAIRNVRVELNVVVEKDAQGRPRYYVLDGIIDNNNVVTQKISFDMALQHKPAAGFERQGRRVYSTRRREDRYTDDRYNPAGPYPPYRGYYMPDIHPVILFGKDQ